MFPRKVRLAGVGYNQFLLASRMVAKFPELNLSPRKALKEVLGSRLSQHRDVTRHFSRLARQMHNQDIPQEPRSRESTRFFNQAYHSSFQDLLPRFPDRSISLLHIDPPYVYQRGTYRSRSARSRTCDSTGLRAAIDLVMDLLRDWQRKLAPNGVVLLWQPWGSLRPEFVEAMEEYCWNCWGPIIWNKQRTQPGDFITPYSVQGEMLWMLFRPGDRPRNHDGSSRESILRFAPVSFPGTFTNQDHAFEKPHALLEYLLLKHTKKGQLIFDACGCTGGMSVAAIRHGRRWVYAESNQSNFEIGEENINRAMPAKPHR
jgi:DNA modification methylase